MKAEADNGQVIDEGCQGPNRDGIVDLFHSLCSQETIAQRRTAERLENTEHKL